MRYSAKRLEALVSRLANVAGMSDKPYVDGKAQVGAIHLGHHFGGAYSLDRITNDAGGITHVSDIYSVREMDAWLLGAIKAHGELRPEPVRPAWLYVDGKLATLAPDGGILVYDEIDVRG